MPTAFLLNRDRVETDAPAGMSLLEFIREVKCLSGTKEACREGECGACTVLVGERTAGGGMRYRALASCLTPLGAMHGRHVATVEGLCDGGHLTLTQQLVVEHSASQCGFCTPGIVMSLTAFACGSDRFAPEEALDALDGNICRCTGYVPIRAAARDLAGRLAPLDPDPAARIRLLIGEGVLPAWFAEIPARLGELPPAPAPPEGATLVGGGTDLFVQRPEALRESPLAFLEQRDAWKAIELVDGALHLGGAVTIEAFRRHPLVREHLPFFERDLLLHSSAILRNAATLAGNVVNASPIGDCPIMLLALGATLHLVNREGARRAVPLARFYQGYKKFDLACGEEVERIAIPLLPPAARYGFEKVSNRTILDIAAVNAALRAEFAPDGTLAALALSAGGVAPVPLLVPGLEPFLGRPLDAATRAALAEAAAAAVAPISDVRGTADYKRLLLRQLTRALLDRVAAGKGA